jgi:GNAT superfamily N-acetyltransferase
MAPLLVFLVDGTVIGAIHIDIKPEKRAVFCLVAIDTPWQGRGPGTTMLKMAETYARARGVHSICRNSVPDAYRLYIRCASTRHAGMAGTQNKCEIPVVKEFTRGEMSLLA